MPRALNGNPGQRGWHSMTPQAKMLDSHPRSE